MSDKKILYFLIFGLLIQVLFSFYYSGEIINQNNILNQNQIKYDSLNNSNQSLQKNLSILTSISNIKSKTASQSFVLIQQSLDINKN